MSKCFSKLQGVIPPMITPFDKEGKVDKAALRDLVRFLKTRVDGLFICGSYGCGPLMSVQQRQVVAEVTLEEVGGGIPVIVHVGCPSTDDSVELAKHAVAAGAERVASVPPYYFGHSMDEVKYHFTRLCESVEVPLYIYNNPKTVGYGMAPKTVKELEERGVKGLKDASFDLVLFADYQNATSREFDIVMGTEALFWPSSVIGARAFIPGMGNAFPELMGELFRACFNREFDKAAELHMKVLAIRRAIQSIGSTVVGVQVALKARGINAGLPKAPFMMPDPAVEKRMLEAIRTAGVSI